MAKRRGVEQREVRRLEQRPWRDPRVLVGVLLVLASTVLGSVAFASQDDTVRYWSVRDGVKESEPVTRADLVATSARLTGGAAHQALRVSEDLPDRLDRLVWEHDLPAGTLLSADDVVRVGDSTVVELPLAVTVGALPRDLERGQVVDVWVGPGSGDGGGTQGASRVLSSVPVVSVSRASAGGDGATSTVVVDTGTRDIAAAVLVGIGTGHVTLVRHA